MSFGFARLFDLVRGVSNIASRVHPTCANLMPISGKPEIGGRPILRDGRYATIAFLGSARTCALLRMRRIHDPHPVISIYFDRKTF